MAKRKRGGRPPQAQHTHNTKPSQHDKRTRLTRPNTQRTRTPQASVPLLGNLAALADSMGRMLDARIAFRLPIVIADYDARWGTSHGRQLVSSCRGQRRLGPGFAATQNCSMFLWLRLASGGVLASMGRTESA